MVYNLTNIAHNASTPVGFISGVNQELMFGYLGLLLLIAIGFVLITSYFFKTGDWARSMGAGMFILSLFAILFTLFGILSVDILIATIVIAAGTVAFTWRRD